MRIPSFRALAAIAAALVFASPVATAASAAKGKAAFVKHGCWQCHGFDGQGSVAGAKLAPNPLALEAFSAFVRNTNGSMPPYQKAILPDGDLADIHAQTVVARISVLFGPNACCNEGLLGKY
jgi:ubiquinol-cytochrome c reductase cytochrome c subunit